MANVKDAATGTVLTAPSPATSGTSLVLNSGEGARFPSTPFYVLAHENNSIPLASTAEKLLVTNRTVDTLTIVRNQGSVFSNQSIAVGWRVTNAIFADDLNNASIVKNEVPGGAVNGSNTVFTVASAGKVTGTLEVYKNGIRLKGGGADYTETATGFTMVTAPATGTVLLADYIVAGALENVGTNSYLSDETPSGSVNGTNTVFTTARAYIAGSLEVYINGLRQKRVTDFTETTPSSGTFTMGTAPATGDTVFVNYQYNLNPSGNSDTVDGIHANTTPTASMLMPLDSSARFDYGVLPLGTCVQVASTLSTANATGTTIIPLDNTIPQITEGTEFMTVTITPKATTNILEIEIVALASVSVNTANAMMALFKDAIANALAATMDFQGTATAPMILKLTHTQAAGTTSAITFRVRLGPSSAGTLTFNSGSGIGADLFGAITKSSIIVREYKA